MIKLVKSSTFDTMARQLGQLQHLVGQLQHLVIDKADTALAGGLGGPLHTAAAQVAELSRLYEGKADWGNQIAQNVINLRAAFIIGSGVKPVCRSKGARRELAFIKAFIDHNNLDAETPQDWAREAEIEGKFLCRLFVNNEARVLDSPLPGMIEARWVPWSDHNYTVTAAEDDYTRYERADYRVNRTGREVMLEAGEFVYKRFGGRTHKVNDCPPKLGGIIKQFGDLDRALSDWRKINSLFAAPTPWFDADTRDEADDLCSWISQVAWKIGKVLVTVKARFAMVGIDIDGIEAIEREIICLIKIISAATGVPVHFLGAPDLMSNRSTADSLMDLVGASTAKERMIWIGAYEELFAKALTLANEQLNGGFDAGAIGADIPLVSAAKLQELADVWLPMVVAGKISLQTFLAKIPEVDPDEELDRLEKEKEESLPPVVAPVVDPVNPKSEQSPAGSAGQGKAAVR